ncbi:MAG: hypothetical protein AAF690_19520 [Acidobacteriota bacterium]
MSTPEQETRFALSLRLVWSALGCMALLVTLALGLQVATAPAETQVQYLPDDAFYYLVLSDTRSSLGMWSFDDGTTLTSGFHPLWAQSLVAFESFRRGVAGRRVRDVVLLCNLLSALSLAAALILAVRRRSAPAALVVPWLFLSPTALRSTVAGVEWPLVVLVALGFVACFLQLEGRRRSATLFVLGLLGSVARTDFGLLPLAFLAISLVLTRTRHVGSVGSSVRASVWGFAGAATGWLAAALFFSSASGDWFQSSVRMKAHWASFEPWSLEDPLRLLLSLYGVSWQLPALGLPLLSLLVAVGLGALAHRCGWWQSTAPATPAGVTSLAAASALLGYVLVYAGSADVQPWYSANLLVPTGVLTAAVLHLASRELSERGVLLVASLLALVSIAASLASVFPVRPGGGSWPHQTSQQAAAEDLARQRLTGPFGAFNAGVVRFASGRRDLLNLDGLVNGDILSHARRGTLPDYIDDMGIQYLLDFETMFEQERYRRRGGYDDPAFLARLQPVRTWQTGSTEPWDRLVLYRVQPRGASETAPALE